MKTLKILVISSLLVTVSANANESSLDKLVTVSASPSESRLAKHSLPSPSGWRIARVMPTATQAALALSAVVSQVAGQSSVGRCFLDGTFAGELVGLAQVPVNATIRALITANQSSFFHTEPLWEVNDGDDDCYYSVPQELTAPVGRVALGTVNLVNQTILQLLNWVLLSQPHVQTASPTAVPTGAPTASPSYAPTLFPTRVPTNQPSLPPTVMSMVCQLSCSGDDNTLSNEEIAQVVALSTACGLVLGAAGSWMWQRFWKREPFSEGDSNVRRFGNPVYTGATGAPDTSDDAYRL